MNESKAWIEWKWAQEGELPETEDVFRAGYAAALRAVEEKISGLAVPGGELPPEEGRNDLLYEVLDTIGPLRR